MPGFDGTGPQGLGPGTARGRGFSRSHGRGLCQGNGNNFYVAPSNVSYDLNAEPPVEQEIKSLENQASSMEQELGKIRKRIEELSKKEGD